MQRRCCWPPERLAPDFFFRSSLTSSHSAEFLSDFSTISSRRFAVGVAVELEAGGHVVVDGHGGKGIGALEDHAHAAANFDRLGVRVDVDVADADGAGDARDGIGLVHAVKAAHEGAFAAARGADQRRGVICRDVEIDVLQRVIGAVPRIQVCDFDADAHVRISPSAFR